MDILSDKTVVTRKSHMCYACNRVFPKKTLMHCQVNVQDGIQAVYSCLTCSSLTGLFPDYFIGDGIFEYGCVDEALDQNETPEQLLIRLEAERGQREDKKVSS